MVEKKGGRFGNIMMAALRKKKEQEAKEKEEEAKKVEAERLLYESMFWVLIELGMLTTYQHNAIVNRNSQKYSVDIICNR